MFPRFLLPSLIVFLLAFNSCVPYRAVVHNVPKIRTNEIFPLATVQPDSNTFHFAVALQADFGTRYRFANLMHIFHQTPLEKVLSDNKTRAFLVIHRDTIIYEQYFKGRDKGSYLTSFSMAKSFMSSLLGMALDEGKISSLQAGITDYLTELDPATYGTVTIEHLLQHTSGLKYKGIGKIYYGKNVLKQSLPTGFRQAPGKGFRYENANSQLLGIIIERVYGKTLPQLWEEKVWTKIGTEHPIRWAMDSKKHQQAKMFCCIDATARDFARLGRVWMAGGEYNGEAIIPATWMQEVQQPTILEGAAINYKYQFWQAPLQYDCFMAAGMYGQMVFMCPEKDLMIVRLGERHKLQMDDKFWIPVFLQLIDQMGLEGRFIR
jgi:CubicO group peptidase (beta-lactamase class C family)